MLGTESDPYAAMEQLLDKILPRPALSSYGMTEGDTSAFADNVIATQQRLLANNYVPLSRDEIYQIYAKLYK